MKELRIVEYRGKRVLTTDQSAEFLETETDLITRNFNRNKEHYEIGEDYFALEGKEKTAFLKNLGLYDLGSKHAKTLYLWTEFGVMLHVKSIDTTKAWTAYKLMLRDYFRLVKESQQEKPRLHVWTEEAERLRQINMKEIRPGYFSVSAFVLMKLIYINLGNMTPNERAKIDISYGQFLIRWLNGDRSGQLKDCLIYPEHPYDKSKVLDIGHMVSSGGRYDVKHYSNIYAGDCSNFWELWYTPVIMPVYFNGKLPDGMPRMVISREMKG
jgi:hypothetical protein